MAVQYTVRADVVDIRTDSPLPTDDFLVDTNVWCWLVYTKIASGSYGPTQNKVTAYSTYVNRALANGSELRRCGVTLAEIAHLIEKTEREVYGQVAGANPQPKEFRHNLPAERTKVVAEVQAAWAQITAMASPIDTLIDDTMTNLAVTRFQTQPVDGYDLFLLEAASAAGIVQVITDDGDYCSVSDIQMYTTNQAVIAAATAQGRLLLR